MEFNFSLNILIIWLRTASREFVNWIIYCQSRSITFFSRFTFFLLLPSHRLLSINIIKHFIIVLYASSTSTAAVRDIFMLIRHRFPYFSSCLHSVFFWDVKSYQAIICNWRRENGEEPARNASVDSTKNFFLPFQQHLLRNLCVPRWRIEETKRLDTQAKVLLLERHENKRKTQ